MEVILGPDLYRSLCRGKATGILPQRPITYKGQNFVNFLFAVADLQRRLSRPHPEAKQFFR